LSFPGALEAHGVAGDAGWRAAGAEEACASHGKPTSVGNTGRGGDEEALGNQVFSGIQIKLDQKYLSTTLARCRFETWASVPALDQDQSTSGIRITVSRQRGEVLDADFLFHRGLPDAGTRRRTGSRACERRCVDRSLGQWALSGDAVAGRFSCSISVNPRELQREPRNACEFRLSFGHQVVVAHHFNEPPALSDGVNKPPTVLLPLQCARRST